MQVGVVKELTPGERRVAIVPKSIETLQKAGLKIAVESNCGLEAGFPDQAYSDAGAQVVESRELVYKSEIILQVRGCGAQSSGTSSDLHLLKPSQTLIGMLDPLGEPSMIREFASTGANLFSLEMIPRITRAQSMDILSSQATIAGYRAVLLAATELPKLFPMMMTAAGTLTAGRVFVIG
ncbi:MAG: NAD(P)(+) transhydrogenase (Re/Si-specific) subunit alpha, partial [Pirellula sp.]